MPYNTTIKVEAHYANSLSLQDATEDKFHATYTVILAYWFPTEKGYVLDHQVMGPGGKPEYIIVRHAGGKRNPLLIVELKRPSKWPTPGKDEVMDELTAYIEGRFDLTQYSKIYGLDGIGLHWMACEMLRRVCTCQP